MASMHNHKRLIMVIMLDLKCEYTVHIIDTENDNDSNTNGRE